MPSTSRRSRRPRRRALTPEQIELRRASVPEIRYPEALPVAQRRDEIAAAIRDHQVVVVAGETGSGKTTQLPKICLELGRGITGTIGHTQPRRLAARTVADRIAEELGVELGRQVGYAVRFTDRVGDDTLVKLMTDGILLNELQRDRELRGYDTIIVDEAHERSLNIDFILGYLAQLLPRRPDLKVIVTSATIETERFSAHFGGAPVIEVSGRTYPVEIRYRPLVDDDQGEARDQVTGIADALRELRREPPGDVLVFLSGEREIRDTADALRALDLSDTEVLPLYARLPTAEQHRVFAPHRGRRIVLATNVAETSLTVPGIRYVVDPGTARISRYSNRLKVQRLPIEAISQASANQRAGRCGRVADGVCIRLYDEEDLLSRPEFTEPEMLRTNLASVILQMTAIGLGDIGAFPFLDPPDRRAVNDGIRLLQELGALETGTTDSRQRLTPLGRRLARLPIDPRFARMILEADRNGCLAEVLVIAAGLSIQDPRERPPDDAAAADALHARFADPTSDFLAYLNLWRYVREQQRALSSSQFRRLCRREHLNHLRVREWQDVHSQLRRVAADLGLRRAENPAEPDEVHRALLSGLLSHIGRRDPESREFQGARNARFVVFPGSSLARRPPQWLMAAELVETSRLFARTVARIQPEWAEKLAPHLVRRSHREPHWSPERAQAMAYETVTLYGLPLVSGRLVGYGRIDPEHARELFLRHALVDGEWTTHHPFLAANRELLGELADLEDRFRRRDLVPAADALEALYDERVPAEVVSGRHFDTWWRRAPEEERRRLTFTREELLGAVAGELREDDFPAVWHQGRLELPLSYAFDPGSPEDGVMVHVPVAVLNQLVPDGFDWQVPGLREELVTELVRRLPKARRRNLVPVPDHVRAFLEHADPTAGPLTAALSRELGRAAGEPIPESEWARDALPPHLRITFRVEAADGGVVGQGDDLVALQRSLARRVRRAIAESAGGVERAGLTDWDLGELPRRVDREVAGLPVQGYPALTDEGATVAVRVHDNPTAQARAMWAGTRRLLLLTVPVSRRAVEGGLTNEQRLALGWSPYAGVDALVDDCAAACVDALLREHGGPVWDADSFARLRESVGAELPARLREVLAVVARICAQARAVERRLDRLASPPLLASLEDVAGQLGGLVHDGFVSSTRVERLDDVERYLRAAVHRLDKLPDAPLRDRQAMVVLGRVQDRYAEALAANPPGGPADAELERIGWMIEELRVSLFAQPVGTPVPVSEQRITRALTALRR